MQTTINKADFYTLSKDGEIKFYGSENECYMKLQRSQSQSADWAIKHEGWKVEPHSFKKEWSKEDFKAVKKAILKHLRRTLIITNHNPQGIYLTSYKAIDECFGLAYTSSSPFAMYSICNETVKYGEVWHYKHFAITTNGMCIAELGDSKENEKYINLNEA